MKTFLVLRSSCLVRTWCFVLGAGVLLSAGLVAQSARPDASSLPGTENLKAFIASRVQKNWTPPKTPWGDPDIQGVFTTKDEANTPFERPDEWAGRKMDDITPKEFAEALAKRQQEAVERAPFAGGGEPEEGVAIAVPIHWFDNLAAQNSRGWFVIDPPEGKVPALTPEGERQAKDNRGRRTVDPGAATNRGGRRDTYLDRSLGDRCILLAGGLLQLPLIYGNSFQIVQHQNHVVIRQEMVHEARMVPLDGRPQPSSIVRSYIGMSRGRWDGNSLVVETTNIHPSYAYRDTSAEHLRVIERFTRIAPNRVERTVTIDNPTVYPRPWTFSFPMTEDNTQLIHEYACHEGNFGMANLLSAGRQADQGRAPR
jgi:hypothetical protein